MRVPRQANVVDDLFDCSYGFSTCIPEVAPSTLDGRAQGGGDVHLTGVAALCTRAISTDQAMTPASSHGASSEWPKVGQRSSLVRG